MLQLHLTILFFSGELKLRILIGSLKTLPDSIVLILASDSLFVIIVRYLMMYVCC